MRSRKWERNETWRLRRRPPAEFGTTWPRTTPGQKFINTNLSSKVCQQSLAAPCRFRGRAPTSLGTCGSFPAACSFAQTPELLSEGRTRRPLPTRTRPLCTGDRLPRTRGAARAPQGQTGAPGRPFLSIAATTLASLVAWPLFVHPKGTGGGQGAERGGGNPTPLRWGALQIRPPGHPERVGGSPAHSAWGGVLPARSRGGCSLPAGSRAGIGFSSPPKSGSAPFVSLKGFPLMGSDAPNTVLRVGSPPAGSPGTSEPHTPSLPPAAGGGPGRSVSSLAFGPSKRAVEEASPAHTGVRVPASGGSNTLSVLSARAQFYVGRIRRAVNCGLFLVFKCVGSVHGNDR